MRTRFILVFIVVLGLAGCTWMPKLDSQGEAVLDPMTGDPVLELVLDEEAVGAAVTAGAPFLPGAFGPLAIAAVSIASMLRRKETA